MSREVELLDVGFGGTVAAARVVAVGNARSAPVQRAVRHADRTGRLVDLSFGRRVRAVLFIDSGHLVQVALAPETVRGRWSAALGEG